MWIDLIKRMRECSNHTAPPFIFYIQCYKIVLMFYNGLQIGLVFRRVDNEKIIELKEEFN